MRRDVYEYLQARPKVNEFIREQPSWYRRLTRNPQDLEKCELASMQYYKQTIPDKVAKFSNSIEMANMMLHMFQAMRQQ